jgi:signal transduction histidine kinase
MSYPTCHLPDTLAATVPAGRRLPMPVATAWESEIERGMAADEAAPTPVAEPAGAPEGLPPVALRQRLGDYALLSISAVAAVSLLAVVLTHALWQVEQGIVTALAFAVLALAGGHIALRARRRGRAAEFRAAQARVEFALRARVADSEARHVRLAAFSELAAQIAHEVRNPLSAIVLNAELLEDELHACIHASPEVKRLARAVSAEAERLTELTNEYLTFARLPRPASTPQALAPLLEEAACFSRSEAERAGVALELDLDRSASAVVDARLLRQVLLNLLRNAVDAMPGGGRLTLRTSLQGGRVALDVIDTGPGVPPAQHEAIFEPFFSTKPHGTGLGLAVARKVARDHGGDLRLLPAPRGAWFRIDLPAAPCPVTAGDGEAAAGLTAAGAPS